MAYRGGEHRAARGRDGSILVVLCLAGLLGLTGVFAWQAWSSARSHRAATEAVVRDYASLAADELVRRSLQEIGYRGFFTLISSLQTPEAESWVFEDPDQRTAPEPRLERALDLARYFFVLGPEGSEFRTTAADLSAEERDSAARRLRAAPPRPNPFGVLSPQAPGLDSTLVYAARGDGAKVGFAAEPAAYGEWFQRAFEAGPLLPAAIGGEELAPERLAVEITMGDATVVFAQGDPEILDPADPYAPRLASSRTLGDAYEGVLEGFTVRLGIDRQAAEALVIGGLPGTRVPLLLGLLGLTAVLLGVAFFQLRRSQAVARLREEFVARVSHELRTPLAQIRMFSETLILGRVRGPEERRRSLEILDQEARRLSYLVENVLHLSRRRRGNPELDLRPRELAPLVQEIVERCRFLVPDGVDLSLDLGPGGLTVTADRDALHQILLNLLDNAVKYGPREQVVRLGAESGPEGRVRLWVEDQGDGVPRGQRERIWESFQRLRPLGRRAAEGTGIGLSVVRDLAGRQGGRAWVEKASGGGARFLVELPA